MDHSLLASSSLGIFAGHLLGLTGAGGGILFDLFLLAPIIVISVFFKELNSL